MILYNVKTSIFKDYDTVIFDLDNTIWNCFNPMGDGIPAMVLDPPYTLLDGNTVKDIRGNIARLDPDFKDILESLDRYGMNLGVVSLSEKDNTVAEAQPAFMLLKKFDLLKYFTYIVVIKRHVSKADYARSEGKTLFIDDDPKWVDAVNKRGLCDVLNRHSFVGWKNLFTESKEVPDEPEFKMQQNAPQPTTSSWKSVLTKFADAAFSELAKKLQFPKGYRKKYLDPHDIRFENFQPATGEVWRDDDDPVIKGEGGTAFFYSPTEKWLEVGHGLTHQDLHGEIKDESHYNEIVSAEGSDSIWGGRATDDGRLVIFWRPSEFGAIDDTNILADCLFQMVQKGVIKKNAIVGFAWDQRSSYSTVPELLHTQGSLTFAATNDTFTPETKFVEGWWSPDGHEYRLSDFGVQAHDAAAFKIIDGIPEYKSEFEKGDLPPIEFLLDKGWLRLAFDSVTIGDPRSKDLIRTYVEHFSKEKPLHVERYVHMQYYFIYSGTVGDFLDRFESLNFEGRGYEKNKGSETTQYEAVQGGPSRLHQPPGTTTPRGTQSVQSPIQKISPKVIDAFNQKYREPYSEEERRAYRRLHPQYRQRVQAAVSKPFEQVNGVDVHEDVDHKAAALAISLCSPDTTPYKDQIVPTALGAVRYFLFQNGYDFPNLPNYTDILWNVASGRLDRQKAYEQIVRFFDANIQPVSEENAALWEQTGGTLASLKFSEEDPLTYTDKSDIDEGIQRSNAEFFHQDDHLDINNQRDHVWGEPWEPIQQYFLDPNVEPTLEDKIKMQHPDGGGIANSSLRTNAMTFHQYVDDLIDEYVWNYLEEQTEVIDQSEIVNELTPAIMEELEDYIKSESVRSATEGYIQGKIPVILTKMERLEQQRKARDEQRKVEKAERDKEFVEKLKQTAPDFLLKKFMHEQFSVQALVQMIKQYIPGAHDIDPQSVEAIVNSLAVNDPKQFTQNGNVIYIGDISQKPVADKIEMNMDEFKDIALKPIEDFAQFGELKKTPDGMYVFKDNGSDILGIAHLDTVQNLTHFEVSNLDDTRVVRNAQLDDRLGAYIILDLLPQLGVTCDVLLTEGEEQGRSTGMYFDPPKKYNWIFQFDRQGMDTVMYQYQDKPTEEMMNTEGFIPAKGSFSDISMMEHLGVKGFNFGTGYYDNHGKEAHAIESHVLHNVKLFKQFYDKYKNTQLPHQDTGRYKGRRRMGSLDITFSDLADLALKPKLTDDDLIAMFKKYDWIVNYAQSVGVHDWAMWNAIAAEMKGRGIKSDDPRFSSLRFADFSMPQGEQYDDYMGTMDPSPKDPKPFEDQQEEWSVRKDLEKRYFERSMHNDVMNRAETDRPATPFASLKFAALPFHTDVRLHKPNTMLVQEGVFESLVFEEQEKGKGSYRSEIRDDYVYLP